MFSSPRFFGTRLGQWECLARFARREFEVVVSEPISFGSLRRLAWELKIEEDLRQDPQPWLNWINGRATIMALGSIERASVLRTRMMRSSSSAQPLAARAGGML